MEIVYQTHHDKYILIEWDYLLPSWSDLAGMVARLLDSFQFSWAKV